MHETGLVRDMVHRIEAAARSAGAERVSGARVWLGALSHLSAAHFREHFTAAAQGTLAEGAILAFEVSDDANHPEAQGVIIKSIDLEV